MQDPKRNHLTLRQLNSLVRNTLQLAMPDEYWVEAELSEARENAGHCYMELIEKDEFSNTPVARASAKCWRSAWASIRPKFLRTTGTLPAPGMKILLRVYPQFHEAYGFSWIVTDIDATYTLGDMARRRREIVEQLRREGVFDLNRQLPLPLFCQRIAVISSATAAGYGDFSDQLLHNKGGLRFTTRLFPATMQGEGVEKSIIAALNQIDMEADSFDCVVIIRGGGASSDLSGFDSLPLAENIANFPLPVITGIGHERDETVADMVAHTRVKTPTAAAALLIDNLQRVADRIADISQRIRNNIAIRMQAERQRMERLSGMIPTLFALVGERQKGRIDSLSQRLSAASRGLITQHLSALEKVEQRLPLALERTMTTASHRLEMLRQRTTALDPELLLSRGYSITTLGGRAVTDPLQLKPGDEIVTRLSGGSVKSVVSGAAER